MLPPGTRRLDEQEKVYHTKIKSLFGEADTEYALSIANVLTSRQTMSLILARIKLFEISLSTHGSIVECGSYRGDGLGLYYNLSSVLEPNNINRKIISFDTFEGFPSVSDKDASFAEKGLLSDVDFDLLKKAIEINDHNRVNGHIPKVEFVVGDANTTIPNYVSENPHLLISYLYLDFDLYEPTKTALEYLLPLVPKGGVVAFDELAQKKWEGETVAFKEFLKANDVALRRFYFEPHLSYFLVGE